LETEVEKKGIKKAKVGLVICAFLVVMLVSSNVWFYTELQNQRNLNNNLQIQRDTLQNQLSLLETTYQNYVSTHRYTNSEYDDYVADHLYTNSEYDDYVADHLYTNSEYAMLYDETYYSFYYVKPEEKKLGVYNLDEELNGLEWTEPYQAGVFDCSEMSACLEWFLENRGWHVKISRGDTPFDSGKHAWLIVETSEGKYMPVESTTLEVVWWSDSNFDGYWEYDDRFETIQEAIDYCESGYDWWKLGFSPLDYS